MAWVADIRSAACSAPCGARTQTARSQAISRRAVHDNARRNKPPARRSCGKPAVFHPWSPSSSSARGRGDPGATAPRRRCLARRRQFRPDGASASRAFRKRPVARRSTSRFSAGRCSGGAARCRTSAGKTTLLYINHRPHRPPRCRDEATLDFQDYRACRVPARALGDRLSARRVALVPLTVEQTSAPSWSSSSGIRGARGGSRCAADRVLDRHRRRGPAMALSGATAPRRDPPSPWRPSRIFILLDEPLAGIDPIAAAIIRGSRRRILNGSRSSSFLITDHNVRETLEIRRTGGLHHA